MNKDFIEKTRKAVKYYNDKGYTVFPVWLYVGKDNKKQMSSEIRWRAEEITADKVNNVLDHGKYNCLALKTGEAANLFVLDVDKRKGSDGHESLEQLNIKIPEDTPCVKTPSGGKHYFFSFPSELVNAKTTRNNTILHLDTRGDGGIIFCPPGDGWNYSWETMINGENLRLPPQELIEWVISDQKSEPEIPQEFTWKNSSSPSENQLRIFNEKVQQCATAPVGQRSERDFDCICWGIEIGMLKAEIFQHVMNVGKFKAKGRDVKKYFDTTFESALKKVGDNFREKIKTVDKKPLTKESLIDEPNIILPSYRVYTANELESMEIPEPRWAVKNFIPEGLSVLAAHPKAGKSFMALNIAYSISSGGKALGWFDIEQPGDCAYIGFESTLHSYKSRLAKMIKEDPEGFWPSNLFLVSRDFPNRINDGLEALKLFIQDYPNLKLLIIDTLEKFLVRAGNASYSKDSELLTDLYNLANDYNLAILCIHHTRKMDADSPYDTISGSYGISANLDGEMVLYKKDNKHRLTYRGRSVEEQEYFVEFDKQFFMWRVKGNVDTFGKSDEQNNVINLLEEHGQLSYKEVAALLSINEGSAKMRLSRMIKNGILSKFEDKYYVPDM